MTIQKHFAMPYSLSVESVEWEQTAMEMLTSTFTFIVIHVSLQGVQEHE